MLKFRAQIIAVMVAFNAIDLLSNLFSSSIYYVVVLLLGLSVIKGSEKLNLLLLGFCLSAILSIVISGPEPFFKAEQRLVSFVLMLLVLGPVLHSPKTLEFRLILFDKLNKLLLFFVIVSVLLNISGLYSGLGRASLFQGLFTHSMIIGPISGLLVLKMLWKLQQDFIKTQTFSALTILILMVLLYALVYSASRSALLSTIIGFIILINSAGYNKKLRKIVTRASLFAVLMVIGLVANNDVSKLLTEKNKSTNLNSHSRSELWQARLMEFQEAPIFGIGFSSARYGAIDYRTGIIEPGTGWGAVLAQVGIVGFILFLAVFGREIRFLLNKKLRGISEANYKLAVCGFFVVHFLFEGYVLASGGILFAYFWIFLGVVRAKLEKIV